MWMYGLVLGYTHLLSDIWLDLAILNSRFTHSCFYHSICVLVKYQLDIVQINALSILLSTKLTLVDFSF